MKLSSIQIGWTLTVVTAVGFLMPWARFAPPGAFADQAAIVAQLAADDWLRDYVLMTRRDWRLLRQNPAAGATGFQVALAERGDADDAARALAEILCGGTGFKNKLLALIPLLAVGGALTLTRRPPARRWLAALTVAELAVCVALRWQLRAAYVDRLALELNWGWWLTWYGLALLALTQLARLLLPSQVKW
ncbi:MAG: hypothetical protein LBK71_00730 [Verrucomicrobiales bacterium]|jgi:hypothetical protein|nr:hypothetical protein [Verrucomicrobiales bacterium]